MPKDEDKSWLYNLEPIIERWPTVSRPEGHVHFRTKMLWTTGVILTYFILSNIIVWGLSADTVDIFAQFRAVLAGASGSIIHLGIGPIVTGGIILQLFQGAGIFDLDLQDPEDKAIYQGTQKLLVFASIWITGIPQVFGFLTPSEALIGWVGTGWARAVIALQIGLGGYLIFLMDEIISKWGVGSGVSLFIVAGVAQGLFTGMFSWLPSQAGAALDPIQNPPGGLIPKILYVTTELPISEFVAGGGFEQIAFVGTNSLVSFIATFVIFLGVVFAESTRVELPLSHARVRGARGRYPIRLMYTNVLPLIFVQALLANVNLIGILLWSGPLSELPFIGGAEWVGSYPFLASGSAAGGSATQAMSGIAYYVSPIQGLSAWFTPLFAPELAQTVTNVAAYRTSWQIVGHVVVYTLAVIIGCIIFAIFWAETSSMGPADVAQKIRSSGMQLPGFRRDERILERVLERYIPSVIILSGFLLGVLAAFAALFGTIGAASGTGLLLAIGILSRTYEEIAKEQMMEMHPMMRSLFGQG
jgi:preprotein translocase subunit SecY